jgi:hypothetical protein
MKNILKAASLILVLLILNACNSAPTDCDKIGKSWALYNSDQTSLTFCYKKSWGIPELKETLPAPGMQEGSAYYISFKDAVNNIPKIKYTSPDFKILGDSDIGPEVDWAKIDFEKTSENLAGLFKLGMPEEESPVAEKITISGYDALRVHRTYFSPFDEEKIFQVDYYLPGVRIKGQKYNLRIFSSEDLENEVGEMVESMKI